MSVRPWANTLVIWVFTHNTTQCQHLVSRLHRAHRTHRTHIVHSTNRTTHVSTSILENTATTCDISMSFWVLRLTRCCVFFFCNFPNRFKNSLNMSEQLFMPPQLIRKIFCCCVRNGLDRLWHGYRIVCMVFVCCNWVFGANNRLLPSDNLSLYCLPIM